ncbi:hypothetical protein EI42_05648 [Thermosporothrix hazakensis]|uniref:LGFP repeat-containing protein n=1 Tax=Thermosporothrix hazakensis TaxID=644383 RepID=A0A326U952_THEHA|nr:hypothetical protein EI42_05648 [Thermosporothrix hazakensis]
MKKWAILLLFLAFLCSSFLFFVPSPAHAWDIPCTNGTNYADGRNTYDGIAIWGESCIIFAPTGGQWGLGKFTGRSDSRTSKWVDGLFATIQGVQRCGSGSWGQTFWGQDGPRSANFTSAHGEGSVFECGPGGSHSYGFVSGHYFGEAKGFAFTKLPL